jgi:predicted phosphodiesterase
MKFNAQQVADARREGKRIIGMMHHGVVSHWKYQNRVMKGYLVDDWKSVAARFAKMGLEVVFTGHSHAQDIACHKSGKATIYDVETGSAVTYPSPYRIVSITDQEMEISSKFIEDYLMCLTAFRLQNMPKRFLGMVWLLMWNLLSQLLYPIR